MGGRGWGPRHMPMLLGYVGVAFFALSLLVLWWCSTCDDAGYIPRMKHRRPFKSGLSRKESLENSGNRAYLMIVILTSPTEWDRRSLIRDTWLAAKDSRTHYYFPIGMKGLEGKILEQLDEEESRWGDILRLPDLKEDYGSLSLKILSTFDSVATAWDFQFLLKVDADSFVDLNRFLPALKHLADDRLYWGFLDGRAHIKTRGKWAEKDWNLSDRYLPYALGGGYVLSGSLVDFISRNKDYLQLYNSEDVSVGAWLAGLKVKYFHDTRFDTEWKSRGCSNKYLITHKQSERQIRDKWKNLRKLGKLCETEIKLRPSYEYNWDTLPSKCCIRVNDSAIP